MKNLVVKMFVLVFVSLLITGTVQNGFYANASTESMEEMVSEFVLEVAEEENYSAWNNATIDFEYYLKGIETDLYEYAVYSVDNGGYVIVDLRRQICVSFSYAMDPFFAYFNRNNMTFNSDLCHYSVGVFAVESNDGIFYIDAAGYVYEMESSINGGDSQINTIIGVPVIMQGTKMCIPFSITVLLNYWDSAGYPGLINGTFDNTYNIIYGLKQTYGGVGSNSGIDSVIQYYALTRGYSVVPYVMYSPSVSHYVSLIDNGKPVLLGYSSSSPYGAHMTVGSGYYGLSSGIYAVVVDGHNSTMVSHIWGSYNDYLCNGGF